MCDGANAEVKGLWGPKVWGLPPNSAAPRLGAAGEARPLGLGLLLCNGAGAVGPPQNRAQEMKGSASMLLEPTGATPPQSEAPDQLSTTSPRLQ